MRVLLKDRIRDYLREIKRHPFRLTAGILVGVFLAVCSFMTVESGVKRLVICVLLSVGTGMFLALPRWDERVNLAVFVCYLITVPGKIFQRMELPIHDCSALVPGIKPLTIWLILCFYLTVFIVSQKISIACGGASVLLLLVFLTEYFVNAFRGYVMTPNDFAAAKTAMQVVGNYRFTLSEEAFYSVLFFLAAIALGFRLKVELPGNWKVRAGITAGAVALVASFFVTVLYTSYLPDHGIAGYYKVNYANQRVNGVLMSFFVVCRDNRQEKPENYSVERVLEVAKRAAEEYEGPRISESPKTLPNIIVIMNESWSDLRVYGDIETTEPVMPFYDSLTDNTLKGHLYVSILGGLTANTEFEALTGDSMIFLPPTTVPYESRVDHTMAALPSVLEAQGYETLALHSWTGKSWSRTVVYDYFGFDDFIDANEFATEIEYSHGFITDACNYRELIHSFENRDKDKPLFLFNVTVQNHGDYTRGDLDCPIDVLSVNGIPASEVTDIDHVMVYSNLVRKTDDALAELMGYFENVEEPTIVCMFGDHQPLLPEDFYVKMFEGTKDSEAVQNMTKYITPYFIWANYDLEREDYGDFSANYLPGVLMECAGLELPPYYKFLRGVQREYPVLSLSGGLGADGSLYTTEELKEKDLIQDYFNLQYCHLREKSWPSAVFIQ